MSETGFPGAANPLGIPPGTAPRPTTTFGQVLDRVLRLMRSHLRLFVSIGLVPGAGIIAFYGIVIAAFFPVLKTLALHQAPAAGFSPASLAGLAVAYAAGVVLMVLLYALYEPAAVYAALELNSGRPVTFGAAWAMAWSRAGRFIWLAILRALIVMLPLVVFGGLILGSVGLSLAHGQGGMNPSLMMVVFPLFMLLYIAWMVYTVLIMLRLVLAMPACVAEDVSAWRAFRLSNQLTHGAKGRIFLLGLLIYAIAYAAFLVAEIVIFFLAAMVALVGMMLHLSLAPWGYIGIGAGVLVFAFAYLLWIAATAGAFSTLFAVVYQDQRARLDGVAARVDAANGL
ncbi:MAG TPA: hypothetical protein VGG45_05820 [Terracidiphilus sp.]|jgi:hypothetical protein